MPHCAANVWQCQAGCSAEQPVAMMLGRALGKLGAVATTAEIAKAVGMPARNVSQALAEWVAARRVRWLPRAGLGHQRRLPGRRSLLLYPYGR